MFLEKSILKSLGLLVLIIALIFTFTACDSDSGDEVMIREVEDIPAVEVPYGTTGEEVISNHLPERADVELSNNETVTVNIGWEVPEDYSGTPENAPETYTFEGSFSVEGEDLTGDFEVEVTVLRVENKALFNVKITDISPSSVEPGDQITVASDISNNGNIEGTQDIVLTVDWGSEDEEDGEINRTESLTLAAENSETVSFADINVPDNAVLGETEIMVESDDDNDTDTVGVGTRITFIEQSGLEGVTVELYDNEDYAAEHKIGETKTDSNGEGYKYFRDGDYWYKAVLDGVDMKDSFTVTGEETVSFRLDFAGGYGDDTAPYKIANWYHLDKVREYGVTNGTHYSAGTYFNLVANLDKFSAGYDELASEDVDGYLCGGFVGIGHIPGEDSNFYPFNGVFNGQGYKIKDLYMYIFNNQKVALFGELAVSAEIKNLGLERVDINGSVLNAGGLVGLNNGTIRESYVTGEVYNSSAGYSGGLVGRNGSDGEIINSYFIGTVIVETVYNGGLVGWNNGLIKNSYSVGEVIGDYNGFGGLIGLNSDGIVENSYYDKDVSGHDDTGKGEPKTSAEMTQQGTFEGWDFDNTWDIDEGNTYPYLRNMNSQFYRSQIFRYLMERR